MPKNTTKLEDITIKYGKTTVQELLAIGYKVADLEQIIQEPTLAQCSLYKQNKKIAELAFYDIKEQITIEDLKNIPIDFVLLANKTKTLNSKQAFTNKVKYTIIIHLVAIGLFYCVYAFPAFLELVRESGTMGVP